MLLLNHHPRTLVQLVLQSLSSPPPSTGSTITGSIAAAFINAASLALLHASSVPMQGVICAAAVGKERVTGNLVLNPDPLRTDLESIGCFGFLFSVAGEAQVVWTEWTGRFEQDEVPSHLCARPSITDVWITVSLGVGSKSIWSSHGARMHTAEVGFGRDGCAMIRTVIFNGRSSKGHNEGGSGGQC